MESVDTETMMAVKVIIWVIGTALALILLNFIRMKMGGMTMSRLIIWVIGIVLVIVLFNFLRVKNQKITEEEVRTMIQNELSVGASAFEIELFFEKHGWGGSYDKFQERYQSIIRDVSYFSPFDKSIGIHIYVDEEKRFVREEVRYSYTFL